MKLELLLLSSMITERLIAQNNMKVVGGMRLTLFRKPSSGRNTRIRRPSN